MSVDKVLSSISKMSRTFKKVLEVCILKVYIGHECRPNDKEIIDIDVDVESK